MAREVLSRRRLAQAAPSCQMLPRRREPSIAVPAIPAPRSLRATPHRGDGIRDVADSADLRCTQRLSRRRTTRRKGDILDRAAPVSFDPAALSERACERPMATELSARRRGSIRLSPPRLVCRTPYCCSTAKMFTQVPEQQRPTMMPATKAHTSPPKGGSTRSPQRTQERCAGAHHQARKSLHELTSSDQPLQLPSLTRAANYVT